MISHADVERTRRVLVSRLLDARTADGHWVGELASSALSTATATIALASARQADADLALAERGLAWLVAHQNVDGGWGDTVLSISNISTTALCWAALTFASSRVERAADAVTRCEIWLAQAAGGLQPAQLQQAIARRYGKDRTFSAPIMTTLALTRRLGADGWRFVPQLPFELAACPPQWFQRLQLPVVSYALPALIAIGQVRHHQRPSRNIALRALRNRVAPRTLTVLRRIQPSTGGYLEATPLTSFVVMSLAGMGQAGGEVAAEGLRFLRRSTRDDGSWPVDTNLATWVTTLSVSALAAVPDARDLLESSDREAIAAWLLAQQHRERHPYTQAAPGGWAWTPLDGGVPDADDTAGALIALKHLAVGGDELDAAVRAGVTWLLGLQNRDGGIPTFCRGWGTLPFDRSAPDLTAHALLAWRTWQTHLAPSLAARVDAAIECALAYLRASQGRDGSWRPLWFGNQHATDDSNATYGTAKVIVALARDVGRGDSPMLARGTRWLLEAQNRDGGWGGDRDVASSIEETAFAVEALASILEHDPSSNRELRGAVDRGAVWLVAATDHGATTPPSPIGLYFAKLWYYEVLYPLIFAAGALSRVSRVRANA